MAVMAREAWTDERLDDLNSRIDRIERRMDSGFAEMRVEFASLRQTMTDQFAAQNRMLIQLFVTTMIGFLGVIATILTQV
jgi:hypothetical protein